MEKTLLINKTGGASKGIPDFKNNALMKKRSLSLVNNIRCICLGAKKNMMSHILSTLRKHYYKHLENQSVIAKLQALQMHIDTKEDLILVHQMGRAASMTVTNTIKSLSLKQPVYHTHWLNTRSVKERVERINSWKKNGAGPLNVRVAELLSPEINKHLNEREWKIISIVREPVARNVSAFFLDIERFFTDFFERYQNNEISLQDMTDVFINEFPHDMPLDWFDVEIKAPFNIDVFEKKYDDQKGYMLIEHDNVSLLVIKLEKLNTCFKTAFLEFFGKEPESLVNTHVTNEDKSFGMYKEFLRDVVLPDNYLDRMYDCDYVRHFFSEAEVQTFRKTWAKKN